MMTLNDYKKKYNIRNLNSIKELIKLDKLENGFITNDEYFVDDDTWRIDLRRIPKKMIGINIKTTILQSINELFHIDYKMLGITKAHFNEYLNELAEVKLIRLVKGKDISKVESYIIGREAHDQVLSNRKKLLKYVDKKINLVLSGRMNLK